MSTLGLSRLRGPVEAAASLLGLVHARERRMLRGLTVLMYHRVLPDAECRDYPFPSLAMPQSFFRAQMSWLAERCEVLPLGTALERLKRAEQRARPLVAVTFDDGYADNRDLAAPIAEEHGIRCTFFVATDFVGDGRPLWFDRAQALLAATPHAALREAWSRNVDAASWDDLDVPGVERLKTLERRTRERLLAALEGSGAAPRGGTPMRPADLQDLAARGHEIASHGGEHSVLRVLSDEDLWNELTESRARLAHWLGVAPMGLAYPDGVYDGRVVAAALLAGYRWACTTERGLYRRGDEPMTIPRRDVTPASVSDHGAFLPHAFRCEVCGLLDPWRRRRTV